MSKIKYFIIIFISLFCITFKVNAESYPSLAPTFILENLKYSDPLSFNNLDGLDISQEQYREIEQYVNENLIKSTNTTYDNIKAVMEYKIDYQADTSNNAYDVFINKKGVCQGYANLFKVFMRILNVPSIIVNSDTTFGAHAYNIIYIEDNYYTIDYTNGGFYTNLNASNFYRGTVYLNSILFSDENFNYYYYNGLTIEAKNNTLTTLNVPSSYKDLTITTLNSSMFPKNNTSISALNIPSSITNITKDYLNMFSNLKNITIDENNKTYSSINNIIYLNNDLYYIPKAIEEVQTYNLTSVEKNTFYNLNNLTQIHINDGVNSISSSAIENCPNLTYLYLPNSITNISTDFIDSISSKNLTIYTDNNYIINTLSNFNIEPISPKAYNYTIIHHYETLDNSYTTTSLIYTINKDCKVEATLLIKEGYEFDETNENNLLNATIDKEGIELKVFYKLLTYTISFNQDSLPTITYKHGSEFSLPSPTKENYNFIGWMLNEEIITIEAIKNKNVNLVAKFEEISPTNNEVSYVINAYYELLDGSYKKESYTKKGTLNTNVSEDILLKDGYYFDEKNINNLVSAILDKENLILSFYYNLYSYTISFLETNLTPLSYKHNANISLPTLEKEGYIFNGWMNENNELVKFDDIKNTNITLTPNFIKINDTINENETKKDSNQSIILIVTISSIILLSIVFIFIKKFK